MIPDTLYDLAFTFRKTKLWKKLYDNQLFAVRHSDGTLGCCCVMGMMGEHLALAEYHGDAGMDSLSNISIDRRKMDVFDDHEIALSQDCLMVSFQNKSELHPHEIKEVNAYTVSRGLSFRGKMSYPQFERFRPHYIPWRLDDETDQKHLAEALEAALEVSDRLILTVPEDIGFTAGAPFGRSIPLLEKVNGAFVWGTIDLGGAREKTYVSPKIADDIALSKLAKCKKSDGEWACSIFMHMEPSSDEEGDGGEVEDPISAPYFPYILLVTDTETGMVLAMQLTKELDDAQSFIHSLIRLAQKAGKPSRILVSDERTHAFFRHLAPALGAKLAKRKRIPSLDEARRDFATQLSKANIDDDLAEMLEMLSNPDVYEDMPDGILLMLSQMVDSSTLPDNIMRLVRRECKRRGM